MTTYFKIRDIEGNVTAEGEAQVDVELPDPTVGIFAESYDIYNIVINNKRLEKQPNEVLENIIIEHPSGTLEVELSVDGFGSDLSFVYGGVVRTARRLFEGRILVPHSIWDGKR